MGFRLVTMAALLLALAGCGGSGDSGPPDAFNVTFGDPGPANGGVTAWEGGASAGQIVIRSELSPAQQRNVLIHELYHTVLGVGHNEGPCYSAAQPALDWPTPPCTIERDAVRDAGRVITLFPDESIRSEVVLVADFWNTHTGRTIFTVAPRAD